MDLRHCVKASRGAKSWLLKRRMKKWIASAIHHQSLRGYFWAVSTPMFCKWILVGDLDEIYKIYTILHCSDFKISAQNYFFVWFQKNTFFRKVDILCSMLMNFCRNFEKDFHKMEKSMEICRIFAEFKRNFADTKYVLKFPKATNCSTKVFIIQLID